jgi:hypothetical protein
MLSVEVTVPNTHIVLARGAVDGTNVKFYTDEPYVPGSTAYILNGRVYSQFVPRGSSNPFGYIESNPDAGEIQVDFAPTGGSVVQILFWDRAPTVAPPVQKTAAVVEVRRELVGVISSDLRSK